MPNLDLERILLGTLVWLVPLIIAIPMHEAAHGLAARWLGDPTASELGRVSLNPIRHIDLFGTILMPLALLLMTEFRFTFGYAKPVPISPFRLRSPRRDMAFVAAAGPLANLFLASLTIPLGHALPIVPESSQDIAVMLVVVWLQLNLVLAVFNLLPIPPLDGGRIAVAILPRNLGRALARLERSGMLILLGLLSLPYLSGLFGLRVDPIGWVLRGPIEFLFTAIARIAGLT
jgi:Zn-dependent protease